MKFWYFNDTGRIVNIHPATFVHCNTSNTPITHLEERVFEFPEGTSSIWVKMWDHGEAGLSILVSPREDID
ncbi:hypothetical protein [Thermaerobacillus caldiproteolyticus]|uniref:hypothetical protein n=1 Tax=Thermaerobacillus caldiproteolyticus TaxID=247480 RepID=UPI0018F1CDE8|nr:hypothetical protein [Anoxybacillus caldiproteolyticus]